MIPCATYSCPYILLSTSNDQPENVLELLIDPEYTLFWGCQCGQVMHSSFNVGLCDAFKSFLDLINLLNIYLHF